MPSAPRRASRILAFVVGLTIVAFGNAVGSITANVHLVLGVPALISRLRTKETDCRKCCVTMLGVSVVLFLLCVIGLLNCVHGIIPLVIPVLVLSDQVRHAARHRRTAGILPAETLGPQIRFRTLRCSLCLASPVVHWVPGCLSMLQRRCAGIIGVSDSAIGLANVAIGTSLPELATTTMAAARRKADVALGNVIGSNALSLLLTAGGAALFGAIPVPREFLALDLWFMLAASVLLAPFAFSGGWEMTRRFGVLFTVIYVVYVILVVRHG